MPTLKDKHRKKLARLFWLSRELLETSDLLRGAAERMLGRGEVPEPQWVKRRSRALRRLVEDLESLHSDGGS